MDYKFPEGVYFLKQFNGLSESVSLIQNSGILEIKMKHR